MMLFLLGLVLGACIGAIVMGCISASQGDFE